MNLVIYLASTVAATIAVTVLLCRYWFAHKRSVSYGTLVLGPVIANFIVLMSLAFYSGGWSVFSRQFWTEGKGGFEAIWVPVGFITAMCVLPALAVIVYYQRRSKQSERPVA